MKIRDLLRNEIVQTIILIAIIIAGVAAFWFGLRFAFQTEFPILAVASGSMEPNLYRGDLIIAKGISNFSELHAGPYRLSNGSLNPTPGEIIVFYHPRYGRVPVYLPVAGTETHLIVHRAISKVENDGTWYFTTRGDNNPSSLSWEIEFSETYVIGKVVGKVPWLGHIALFIHENRILATLIIGFLFVVLVIVDFVFPKKRDEKTRGQEESC